MPRAVLRAHHWPRARTVCQEQQAVSRRAWSIQRRRAGGRHRHASAWGMHIRLQAAAAKCWRVGACAPACMRDARARARVLLLRASTCGRVAVPCGSGCGCDVRAAVSSVSGCTFGGTSVDARWKLAARRFAASQRRETRNEPRAARRWATRRAAACRCDTPALPLPPAWPLAAEPPQASTPDAPGHLGRAHWNIQHRGKDGQTHDEQSSFQHVKPSGSALLRAGTPLPAASCHWPLATGTRQRREAR